ncbi:MAG: hypothetical protein HQ515_21660 [Phycisphaeraceae bacterium]|nr:hypothetical protein [Phycisphaeraceae bacterium]
MKHTELQSNVRILATLQETEYPVVSAYLNTDRGVSGCLDYLAQRVPLLSRTMAAEQRDSFDQSMAYIEDYVRENAHDPDVRGIVVFGRTVEDPFLLQMRFPVPVPNQLVVDRVPHICQLVTLKNTYDRYVVILMTKERASIMEVNLGAVTRQTWSKHLVSPNRVEREWSKERYQRHREKQTHETIQEKIKTLDGLMSTGAHSHLILAGEPAMVSRLQASLPAHLRQKLVDTIHTQASTHPGDVVNATLAAFVDFQKKQSHTSLARLQQAVYTNGLGVLGTAASLQCLRYGQADVLFLAETYAPGLAWQCLACGDTQIGQKSSQTCPECSGSQFRSLTLKEEMVRLAEVSSCAVTVVQKDDFLMAGGGVGCLTRY